MQPTNKLYVVRVINDRVFKDRFYDEYFFNAYEANRFYDNMKELGFDVAKREEDK